MSFIQIGANDGVRNDPIRQHVFNLGWRGVFVEPIPEVFKLLVANYSAGIGLSFENAAICRADGPTPFYLHPRHSDCSGLSIKTRIQRKARMQRIEVNGMTFSTLLRKHKVQKLDVLQIDTEGYDFDIIQMLDFTNIIPAIIRYEHTHIDRLACREYLAARGYQCFEEGRDTIAYGGRHIL